MRKKLQRPTRQDIKDLSEMVKITPLLEKAGLNPNTLRKVLAGVQPRELHEEERRAVAGALADLRDRINAVL